MTREIALHLGRLGAKVFILPVSSNALDTVFPREKMPEGELGYEYDGMLSANGVQVKRVPQHKLHFQLDGLAVRRAIREIGREHDIDCVLSYYNEAAFLPGFLRSRGIRFGYISTWQSYAWAEVAANRRRHIKRLVDRLVYDRFIVRPHRQADVLFATSEFTRRELIEVLGVDCDRIHVCYLGVDSHFADIARQQPGKNIRLIYFGRVVVTKGILDSMVALGKLHARGISNWSLRVVGPAGKPAVARARKLAQQYGISDKISYREEVDDAGLKQELKNADLALMPSHSESFGLAFAESQAAGVPVIAYEVGSIPEVVEDGVSGWLAPFGDIEQLSLCIEKALQNPDMLYRAGLAGRQRVLNKFSWEKTARTIYDGVMRTLRPTTAGDRHAIGSAPFAASVRS